MNKSSLGDSEQLMFDKNKDTLMNFQKLKVPKLEADTNKIMLIEYHDFGFKSKNKRYTISIFEMNPSYSIECVLIMNVK